MLPDPPPPSLRLTIDSEALAHNWRVMDRLSGDAPAGAAVKADCYGLGVHTCVPVLRDAGCEAFFVAHWSEVEAVARHVPAHAISVLHGVLNAQEVSYAMASGAVPVINSVEQARIWKHAGGGPCHLMVDTGINRLGISGEDVGAPEIQSLNVDILMSHLACADEDSAMNDAQAQAFAKLSSSIPHRRKSLANSAGVALGRQFAFDLTRPGLALYGGVPRVELAQDIRQVAHIEAAILQTRTLHPGDSVGYNAKFTASAPMPVGTVALGYADGFLRARGVHAELFHGDQSLRVLGTVSMDMIVVDLSNAPHLRAGDWLKVPFSLPDAAQQSIVSQYELLTTIGNRLRQ